MSLTLWFALLGAAAIAPESDTPAPAGRPVIVTGSVPDEATKAGIVARLTEIYGASRVIDEITVDQVVAPANWDRYVGSLLNDTIRGISPGEIHIDGNSIRLSGEVASESRRQAIASHMAGSLNPTYTIHNQLEVGTHRQSLLDQALAGRIVEFQSGSAALTPRGREVLDQMAQALADLEDSRVEIAGHTDAVGDRRGNIQLSLARASEVKAYLVERGVASARLSVMGHGPDRPLADNDTEDGRARNRRIEFRVLD